MQRYFFDVATQTYVEYDFRGRDFERPEQARQLAEMIALDIECIDADEVIGREVQVRDISGRRLFSVPIREPEQVAA
jgi:hypothetical protein